MISFPKMLISIGLTFVIIGIVWIWSGPFLNLGKLPGDLLIQREHFKFYFPITTSVIVSIVLSIVAFIICTFTK